MFVVRFVLPLFLALTSVAALSTPLAEEIVSRWFRKDVEMRSTLIFQSAEFSLSRLWAQGSKPESYKQLFENIARDERVLAVGLCSFDGKIIARSAQWAGRLRCSAKTPREQPLFQTERQGEGHILTASFPLPVDSAVRPSFVVMHDLSFAVERVGQMRYCLILFLIFVSCIAAAVTLVTARLAMRSWIGRLRLTLSDPAARFSQQRLPREFLPVVREVRQMLREIKVCDYQIDRIKVEWTPQALSRLLKEELPDSEVIVVSNREPYIHNRENGQIRLLHPASGVVTALEPITRACKGTWIAHGSGTADKEMVDKHDHIQVPPDHPEYTLRRIWLSKEEEEGYYFGFANEGIYPLCLITFVKPVFRESDWQMYKEVNRKFAQAVIDEAKTPNPIVLIQDYHFALAPRMIREALPGATIITFWHIPWPNPELFSICPWREEILRGLLGSSVLGFHTQFHCQNFKDTAARFLECNIKRDQSIITCAEQSTFIAPYPVSIPFPPEGFASVPPVPACKANVWQRFNLGSGVRIGIGIERSDYSKGISDRLQSLRAFFEMFPEWRGKVTFIQIAAPSRTTLPAYQSMQREIARLVDEINAAYGSQGYKPIILVNRHHESAELLELMRAADFCMVSSLHDGMNLVAKEFVAARDDNQGVLILSHFTGASKELLEAIPVNPYDMTGMAQAINMALTMPAEEQRDRMRLLREMVRENNIYFWAAHILLDAARLRKRDKLAAFSRLIPEKYEEDDLPL